jgi:hypothetical protein
VTQQEVGSTAAPIVILLSGLPAAVAHALTERIGQAPDMRLAAPVAGVEELLVRVAEGVDVLILGAPRSKPPPGICSILLGDFPHLRILLIGADAAVVMMYWMGLRSQREGFSSPSDLLHTIRRAYYLNPAV